MLGAGAELWVVYVIWVVGEGEAASVPPVSPEAWVAEWVGGSERKPVLSLSQELMVWLVSQGRKLQLWFGFHRGFVLFQW